MNDTRALIRSMFAVAATFSLAGCCGYGHSFRPHPLEIVADEQGCPTSVEKAEGYICIDSAGAQGLCAHPGDWVEWSRGAPGGFEIQFTGFTGSGGGDVERTEGTVEPGAPLAAASLGSSPIERDCELNTDGQSLKCRISEDAAEGTYKYSVIVQDCEVLDPRIIIRRAALSDR